MFGFQKGEKVSYRGTQPRVRDHITGTFDGASSPLLGHMRVHRIDGDLIDGGWLRGIYVLHIIVLVLSLRLFIDGDLRDRLRLLRIGHSEDVGVDEG